MSVKIQLGFTADGASAPFLTLDDPIKGRLDDPRWVLGGGEGLVEVTDYVRSFNISRGKSRELDKYQTGSASVQFNNENRYFDPTYAASPFFGQLVPYRALVITVDDVVQFTGIVDDYNIEYDLSGMSYVSCTGSDIFAQLASLELVDYVPDEEISGTRIDNALTNAGWSVTARNIDAGSSMIASQVVDDGTNLLAYIQAVAASEFGDVYATKDGKIRFIQRNGNAGGTAINLGEGGIAFNQVQAMYGSELLYNYLSVSNEVAEVVVSDADSISAYGQRDISIDTYLANEADLEPMANFLLSQYKDPEYRFEAIGFKLKKLSPVDRAALLNLELGQIVVISFTPSGIPPQVVKAGKVIRIEQNHNPNDANFVIGIQTFTNPVFILDDPYFGRLDTAVLGY